MSIKGYKGLDKDLKCRGKQYEIGQTYEMAKSPSVCNRGFHFCEKVADIHEYYKLGDNRVCEIEALGEIVKEGNKSATNKIKIIRELSREEIRTLGNSGTDNTGYRNSGYCNSGYCNSGDCNSGNRNSGDCNSGNRNSGNRNSGDCNSGYRNSGDCNSGNRNSGDCNSGDCNSGNRNSGYCNSGYCNSGEFNSCNRSAGVFMSKRISFEAFNKSLTEEEFNELINSRGYRICRRFELVRFRIRAKTGKFGDFRYLSYKSSWNYFWYKLSFEERMEIRKMPHFDKDVFFEITGIKT
jgi:hypothetical protein